MKKIMTILLLLVTCLYGCTIEHRLRINTNFEVKKAYHKADTIYVYSVAFNNWTLLWYHKNGCIYKRYVYPNRVKRKKAIVAMNYNVNMESIRECFEPSMFKDVECFEGTLDGESIEMYVKGEKKHMDSSINTDCLFQHKYEEGSFQYKLQYDLCKILYKPESKELYP